MTTEKIVIVTWLWKNGFRPIYDHRHVNRLYKQLKKHMTGDWRLVCVTDDPAGIECDTFPLWDFPQPVGLDSDAPNCFVRLELFDPKCFERVAPDANVILSVDLDSTIYRDLRPLITKSGFKAAVNKKPKNGQLFCGTLWQLRKGYAPQVRAEYHPECTPQIINLCGLHGSDQSWFTLMLHGRPTWNEMSGVYWSKRLPLGGRVPSNARIVYFAGSMKPWDQECQTTAPYLYDPL